MNSPPLSLACTNTSSERSYKAYRKAVIKMTSLGHCNITYKSCQFTINLQYTLKNKRFFTGISSSTKSVNIHSNAKERGKQFFRLLKSYFKNCSLGNHKWLFCGITANPSFIFKSVDGITFSSVNKFIRSSAF